MQEAGLERDRARDTYYIAISTNPLQSGPLDVLSDRGESVKTPPRGDVVPKIAPFRIELDPELIVRNRLALRQQVMDALHAGHRAVVLDLARCRQIDSAGLGVLVSCAKRAREAGAQLSFEHVGDDLRSLFELTGLSSLLDPRAGSA